MHGPRVASVVSIETERLLMRDRVARHSTAIRLKLCPWSIASTVRSSAWKPLSTVRIDAGDKACRPCRRTQKILGRRSGRVYSPCSVASRARHHGGSDERRYDADAGRHGFSLANRVHLGRGRYPVADGGLA